MNAILRRGLRCMLLAVLLGAALAGAAQEKRAAGHHEFFAFDNGVGRGQWTPEQQAATLKELGYDGISYNYTTPAALESWLKAFDAQGLKIYGLYIATTIGRAEPLQKGLPEAIKMLKGRDTILWMNMMSAQKKREGQDAEAVKLVRRVAAMAKESGLRVALYGHKGMYLETGEDAERIVKQAGCDNVGCSMVLCHELASGNGKRMNEAVKNCAPHLMLVAVCGADNVGPQKTGENWDHYIKTLDQGDFDVAGFLKQVQAAGYTGPVGLQCYMIKGDIKENLAKSIAAWRKISAGLEKKEQ